MHKRWKAPSLSIAAAVLVLGSALAITSPALAASGRATSKPMTKEASAQALAAARAFLSHIKVGAPMHRVGPYHGFASDGITPLSSTNWSGYADTGSANSFSAVSGTWVEPTGTCGSGVSLAAFWVGIDGISAADPTVQQDGTIIECSGGSPVYADWWETYPGNSVQIEKAVNPGDVITASVVVNGSYQMKVTDSTHSGDSFSVTEPCGASTCKNKSAEWIAEAPCCVSGGNVYPLTNFGTWKVTSAATTYKGTPGSISVDPNIDKITMVDGSNAVKAAPGNLKASGTKFKDTWERSS
ncbi:MAG: G1 family glutamic endopeptidase [Acidimicrobiales bacterium]